MKPTLRCLVQIRMRTLIGLLCLLEVSSALPILQNGRVIGSASAEMIQPYGYHGLMNTPQTPQMPPFSPLESPMQMFAPPAYFQEPFPQSSVPLLYRHPQFINVDPIYGNVPLTPQSPLQPMTPDQQPQPSAPLNYIPAPLPPQQQQTSYHPALQLLTPMADTDVPQQVYAIFIQPQIVGSASSEEAQQQRPPIITGFYLPLSPGSAGMGMSPVQPELEVPLPEGILPQPANPTSPDGTTATEVMPAHQGSTPPEHTGTVPIPVGNEMPQAGTGLAGMQGNAATPAAKASHDRGAVPSCGKGAKPSGVKKASTPPPTEVTFVEPTNAAFTELKSLWQDGRAIRTGVPAGTRNKSAVHRGDLS
ncbi:extensin-like isoform X1 [Polypterus senegalus]|uniref:extensin-like isoform X1 n=1 Tax=Polypterus senegalus TaxID=55291 RepID=UPI001965FE7B|nr:extensin-like isoform X1 [Polypterus senegalus]